MNNYIIYKHTNKINSKCYIGITQQLNYKKRWQNGLGYKRQPKFFKAIQKYGWENFTHEILYTGLSVIEANQLEKKLIIQYNSIENGYNITEGGDNDHYTKSPETIKKLQQLKWITNGIVNKRINETVSLKLFPGFYFGYTRSDYHKQIQQDKNNTFRLKKRKELEKWILERHVCEHCGKIMTEKYGSGRFCCKTCAVTHKHSIETKKKISNANNLGLCGNKGKHFTEDHKQKLSHSHLGKTFTEEHRQKISNSKKGVSALNAKKVRCIETGEIFNSIQEAQKIYHCCVGLYLLGKLKKEPKYHWELI